MSRTYKDEIGNRYGPYEVVSYTKFRAHCNGCVIWQVKCKCGHISYFRGDVLRFNYYGACPKCGRRD